LDVLTSRSLSEIKRLNIDIFRQTGHKGKKFDKTKKGAFKYWELERCLDDNDLPH
jgi:hypothetical protein